MATKKKVVSKKSAAVAKKRMCAARTPEQVFEACRAAVIEGMPLVFKGILEQGKQGSVQHARFLVEFVNENGEEARMQEEDVTETLLKEIQRDLGK